MAPIKQTKETMTTASIGNQRSKHVWIFSMMVVTMVAVYYSTVSLKLSTFTSREEMEKLRIALSESNRKERESEELVHALQKQVQELGAEPVVIRKGDDEEKAAEVTPAEAENKPEQPETPQEQPPQQQEEQQTWQEPEPPKPEEPVQRETEVVSSESIPQEEAPAAEEETTQNNNNEQPGETVKAHVAMSWEQFWDSLTEEQKTAHPKMSEEEQKTLWAQKDAEFQEARKNAGPIAAPGVDTTPIQAHEFAIITATSENHFDENVNMLRSLREVRYTGPIYLYMMFTKFELNKEKIKRRVEEFEATVAKVEDLDVRIRKYYEDAKLSPMRSYCFKPHVIQQTLDEDKNLKAIFWSDSSTRFKLNPFTFGQHLQEDGVMFGGRRSVMGMGENTHPLTYAFLGKNVNDYYMYKEIAATQWSAYVYPRDDRSFYGTLQRWFDCAAPQNCRRCMAPSMDPKTKHGPRLGAGNKNFVVPRQDQAVLGLLIYEHVNRQNATGIVPPGQKIDYSYDWRYMGIRTGRNNRAQGGIAELLEPVKYNKWA